MKKLSTYILKHSHLYILSIVCLIIQVGLDMLSPQITKSLIDDVLGNGDWTLFPWLLIGIAGIGVGRCIFGYIKEYNYDRAGSKIANCIRRDLFHHVQSLSIGFFDKTNTGELMSRVKDDVDRIWDVLSYVSMLVLEVIIHTSMILFCIFRLSPKLAVIPLVALPIVAAIAIFMERKLDKIYEDISEENATLNTVAQENLAGVRTVKSFAREKFEISKFLSHNKRYYELNMQQSKVFIRYQPIVQLITKLLPVIAVILGGFEVIRGEMTLGTLTAFAEYCMNIVWPIEMLGWLSNSMAAGIASNKRIRKVYEEVPIITDPETPETLNKVEGHIRFDHVSLTLNEKEILKDISFDLQAGKTLGIMGCTGSGKTTIVDVMLGLLRLQTGKILADGVDVQTNYEGWLKNIGYIPQTIFMIDSTIRKNVAFGINMTKK